MTKRTSIKQLMNLISNSRIKIAVAAKIRWRIRGCDFAHTAKTINRFILIPVFWLATIFTADIQAQVKVIFDQMEADSIVFNKSAGNVKINMLPDSDTHFQVNMDDGEIRSSYTCYSKRKKKLKIKELEQLRKNEKIFLDGMAVIFRENKNTEEQIVYKDGNRISKKEIRNNILFSETSYDEKKKFAYETLFYPSGVLWATIQSHNKDSYEEEEFDIVEYYETGAIKRREINKGGNLTKKEYYTPTGQDTVFATPFMKKPEYPGGLKALSEFIKKNIRYPLSAYREGKYCKVIVHFYVSETGEIRKPVILQSCNPDLDKAALNVVSIIPKWEPGIVYGEATEVFFNIPIVFNF
jgi:TonB family protein